MPTLLLACSPAAPPAPAPTSAPKPAADAKPTEAAKPAADAKPAATPLTGAQIGGAQPTAIATVTGELQNPVQFQAPKIKASAPTTLTFWQYVGFHVNVQKFIGEEYKKQHDPNVSLEITAYPGLNEQRTAVKAALAAGSPTPEPTPVAGDAFAFYEVSVGPDTYTLYAVEDGSVGDDRVVGFDQFSFARVEPQNGDDGNVYWVTRNGDLAGFGYRYPDSGDFRIRAVFLNDAGDRRSAFLAESDLDQLPEATPAP